MTAQPAWMLPAVVVAAACLPEGVSHSYVLSEGGLSKRGLASRGVDGRAGKQQPGHRPPEPAGGGRAGQLCAREVLASQLAGACCSTAASHALAPCHSSVNQHPPPPAHDTRPLPHALLAVEEVQGVGGRSGNHVGLGVPAQMQQLGTKVLSHHLLSYAHAAAPAAPAAPAQPKAAGQLGGRLQPLARGIAARLQQAVTTAVGARTHHPVGCQWEEMGRMATRAGAAASGLHRRPCTDRPASTAALPCIRCGSPPPHGATPTALHPHPTIHTRPSYNTHRCPHLKKFE